MESYKTLQRQKFCPPHPLINTGIGYSIRTVCIVFFQGGCTWDEPYPDEIGLNIEEKKE